MSSYDHIKDLPLRIDGYGLEPLTRVVSAQFTRRTTVIHLHGDGGTGLGEDVVYDIELQDAQQEAGPVLELDGDWTIDSFSAHLGTLDLFHGRELGSWEVYRAYRRWAFESAALDLALRQSGTALHEALHRVPAPITFVMSMRLPEPPSLDPIRARLAEYPTLRFKLDPQPSWDESFLAELAQTGAVDSFDLKGAYKGTIVDVETDPALYRRLAEMFPDAWIEDPDLEHPEARAVLEPHRDRVTWDAPIHSIADIENRLWRPRTINIKPSRFGSLRALFDAYDWTDAQGIGAYGGGQSELGVGRGQIQELAAIFHPDAPNDIAPAGYDWAEFLHGLPASPLAPDPTPTGFRRRGLPD